jgi:hypothetical protein
MLAAYDPWLIDTKVAPGEARCHPTRQAFCLATPGAFAEE